MSSQRFKDAAGVLRGLDKVARSTATRRIQQINAATQKWNESELRGNLEKNFAPGAAIAKLANVEVAGRARVVGVGFWKWGQLLQDGVYPGTGGVTDNPFGHIMQVQDSEDIFDEAIQKAISREASVIQKAGSLLPDSQSVSNRVQEIVSNSPEEERNYKKNNPRKQSGAEEKNEIKEAAFTVDFLSSPKLEINPNSKQRRVPSSRLGRVATFGSLGVGLGMGAIAEMTRKSLGLSKTSKDFSDSLLNTDRNPFLSEANVERIVDTLCRVRGAALKLGQMISIQDNALISPQLQKIFERVRYSADFMPRNQVMKMIKKELGSDWEKEFQKFHEEPFAAASIGQVHEAVTKDGRNVAMKIQYPGVSESIDSDIDNLMTVAGIGNIFPKGAYIADAVRSARKELALECDYLREAKASQKMAELLSDDPNFYVPKVIDELTTRQVLTTELMYGTPVDRCTEMDQESRNWIGEKILGLVMRELFDFRFMQTDPNWANFLYQQDSNGTRRIVLLDFGATRPYKKEFVDPYLRILIAAGKKDRQGIVEHSRTVGMLTGYETKVMNEAHVDAVMILGEALASEVPFDFGAQDITRRVSRIIPIMAEHRLTPPPEEIYSLHRKLSGAFLLCAKLRSSVHCWPVFKRFADTYTFGPETQDRYPEFSKDF